MVGCAADVELRIRLIISAIPFGRAPRPAEDIGRPVTDHPAVPWQQPIQGAVPVGNSRCHRFFGKGEGGGSAGAGGPGALVAGGPDFAVTPLAHGGAQGGHCRGSGPGLGLAGSPPDLRLGFQRGVHLGVAGIEVLHQDALLSLPLGEVVVCGLFHV